MPIKCTTTDAAITNHIRQLASRQEKALINTLAYVGEMCVNEARSYNGKAYIDRTGNLRSSVGYIIAVDGKVRISSTFDAVREGAEGAKQGRRYAKQIIEQYPSGVVLVIVAGMHYAKYVEARGYNVLQSSELLAEQLVPQMLRQLELITDEQ